MQPLVPAIPTHERAALPTMVMVVVHWDDQVIFAGVVKPGGCCRLGEGPGAIPVPSSVLGAEQLPIVVHRQGEPRVVLPRRATGALAVGLAPPESIDRFRPLGTLRRMAPEAVELPLPLDATVRLAIDPITIVVSRTRREPALRHRRWAGISRRLAVCHGAATIPFVALLGAGAAAMPALGETPGDLRRSEEPVACYLLGVGFEGAAAPEPPIGLARDSEQQRPEWVPGDGVPCRCRPTDADMGCPEGKRDGRYGVMGPTDNPDPHLARVEAYRDATNWLSFPWSVGPLIGIDGDRNAPTAPFGRDDSLGTDAISAKGHLWGAEIAPAPGDRGLTPDWQEGGLVKTIEPVPPSWAAAEPTARASHSGLVIRGALSARAVLQALAPRLVPARECYRAALEDSPDLAGRIDVELTPSGNGAGAARVRVASSTIAESALTSCVAAAFDAVALPWPAPAPTGTDEPTDRARVVYPIWLTTGPAA